MKLNSKIKDEDLMSSPTCGKPTVMGSTASIREIEGINRVHHLNFLNNTLPDKCANLIIADPPYFEVKGAFDFVWEDMKAYLLDVEKWAKECKRLLADNGTLFWYGHVKNIHYSQVVLDDYFNFENHITWVKKDGMQYQYYTNDTATAFTSNNERLIMYSSKGYYDRIRQLLKTKRIEKGYTIKQMAEMMGVYTALYGFYEQENTGSQMPTKKQYEKIKEILHLDVDYYDLARFFNNDQKLSDCIEFSQEGHITKHYDHPTKKPETLTRALIQVCSRKNDLVLVPFAGSGTECAMSVKEGRRAIGFDIEEKYCKMSNRRVQDILRKPELFQ